MARRSSRPPSRPTRARRRFRRSLPSPPGRKRRRKEQGSPMSYDSLPMERGHFEAGLVPVADFLVNGAGVASDVINMKLYEYVRFILFWGVGATGTNTLTIEACDNVTPSNTVAVPFFYR